MSGTKALLYTRMSIVFTVSKKLHRVLHLLRGQRRYFKTFKEPRNRSQGIDSLSLSSQAGWYDNHIPTLFLAPIDFSKIPAQFKP